MSPEALSIALLITLLVIIFLGFPIAFTLLLLAMTFGYLGFGKVVFDLAFHQIYGSMKEEVLAAVPLFVFMGHLLERSGLMERLFRAFQSIMGPVRGSLYLGVLVTCTLFAAATGIIGASVTIMGLVAAPAMIKSRYDPKLSAGAITSGGTLGILIPPSVMLVVLGPIAGVSILRLFAAAIMPGLLLAFLYIAYTMIRCYFQPQLGPALPSEERISSPILMLREFLFGMVPLAFLILATLGAILAGLATPTEAAAMGAFGAFILTVAYRKLSWELLKGAAFSTIRTSSLVLFLATTANIYGAVFSRLGGITLITESLLKLGLPPEGMIILLLLVIFLLGWPLEWPAIIFIFLPIFLPVVKASGCDLLWFSVLVAVNLQTAFLSPPVAMAAFYLKGVVPQWELKDIYIGMLQFMALQLLGLALVFLFPQIALWLPELLYGK